MFRATSSLLQDFKKPKPYFLALAYVSARNDTPRKQWVERCCESQNIIPAKDFINENYIKKITSVGQASLETHPPYRSGKSRGRGANRSSGQGYSQSPLGQAPQESSSVRFEQMHGYEQSHLSGYTTAYSSGQSAQSVYPPSGFTADNYYSMNNNPNIAVDPAPLHYSAQPQYADPNAGPTYPPPASSSSQPSGTYPLPEDYSDLYERD
jgi:hypothetical protein